MLDAALNKAIRDYIRTVCSMGDGLVRPAYQDSPVPSDNTCYCTVNIINTTPDMEPDVSYVEEIDPITLILLKKNRQRTMKKHFVSVIFHNSGAVDKAQILSDSFAFEQKRFILLNSGLTFVEASGVRKIPEVINGIWYDRAQMDIYFYEDVITDINSNNFASAYDSVKAKEGEVQDVIKLE